MERDRPQRLAELIVVAEGPSIPCVPLIVSASASDAAVERFRSALRGALTDLPELDRNPLLITGFHDLDEHDYEHLTALAVRP